MRDHLDAETTRKYAELISRYCADSIVITDRDGVTEWVNDAFTKMTGFTVEDMVGKKPGQLLQGAATSANTVQAISEAVQKRRPVQTEILNYDKKGKAFWIELNINPVFDAAGNHTHFIASERDVSERKRLEALNEERQLADGLRQEERKLLSQTSEWLYSARSLEELLRVVQTAMHTIFPETSGQLYTYSNSRDTLDLSAEWGVALEAPAQHLDADCCWGLRRGRAYAYGMRAIEFPCEHHKNVDNPSLCLPIIAHGETIGLLTMEFPVARVKEGDGASHGVFLRQRQELALLCAEQISLAIANVQLRQELQDQSTRDPLTSLWNRRWFLDATVREINRMRKSEDPVSLISLDVDHFKKFNDHHGHDAGDVVLREVGELMTRTFLQDCYPCRIGGEEFVVLCPGRSTQDAAGLAETFRAAISMHSVPYGREVLPRITVSAGVATYPADGKEVITLLRVADDCLYKAKETGRDRVVTPQMLARAQPKAAKAKAARKSSHGSPPKAKEA